MGNRSELLTMPYGAKFMSDPTTDWREQLAKQGFVLLQDTHSIRQIETILTALDATFAADASNSTLRAGDGSIYGARNLLRMWPGVVDAWKMPPLPEIVSELLGAKAGLVRVLYFDKPPEQSWALPWHKDHVIAVQNNHLPSEQFSKPTTKAGVPHVDAPTWLLEQMLTLRLHLDDVTDDNGPLRVLPGSHRGDEGGQPTAILCQRGDVLVMRPLLSHCSNKSREGTHRQRRILHFEFAGVESLPDGYRWHDFGRFA
jgi:hypothetical protein